jgi:phosphatidylethanolamine-binding protein (PEBP) family uncharacterized protein
LFFGGLQHYPALRAFLGNITNHLPKGVSERQFTLALNDAGRARYDGPKPPKGHGSHHYHFRLAALDVSSLKVQNGCSAVDLWRAAEPHILAEVEFVGTYETI